MPEVIGFHRPSALRDGGVDGRRVARVGGEAEGDAVRTHLALMRAGVPALPSVDVPPPFLSLAWRGGCASKRRDTRGKERLCV